MSKLSFNKSQLQYIAIIAMVIDHVSYFAPLPAYYVCQFIGRITIVIMSYFIAEGYYRTRDLDKYILRMGIFAAVSQVPFYLFKAGKLMPHELGGMVMGMYYNKNVIFALFLGLCLLTILRSGYNIIWKLISVFLALVLSVYSDWSWFCLMWVCTFGLLYGNTKGQMRAAVAIILIRVISCIGISTPFALVQFGGLLAIPLLKRYNGERGNAPRMLFYVFYPAHLLLLFIAKLLIA